MEAGEQNFIFSFSPQRKAGQMPPSQTILLPKCLHFARVAYLGTAKEIAMPTPKALIELHFLPNLAFMAILQRYGHVVFEAQESYVKRSYRNRCLIGDSNGPLRLSLPLSKGKNENQPIRDVRLSYGSPWLPKLWHSIRSVYNKSPYFEHYADELYAILASQPTHLFDLNLQLLRQLMDWIGMDIKWELSTDYHKQPPSDQIDWRQALLPRQTHGDLAALFNVQRYPQVFEEKTGFLPNLSVIDLLFCTGPESLFFLEQYAALLPDRPQKQPHESTH